MQRLRKSESAEALQESKANGDKTINIFAILCIFAIGGYVLMGQSTDYSAKAEEPLSYLSQSLLHFNESKEYSEEITLWSSDFHISPIADFKHLLSEFNVKIIDKSLSGHCHLTDTCQKDLKIIMTSNGINLDPCTNQLRKSFYDSYRNDPIMETVDAFICTHATSMCELFMPFNKPMIIIASTRYEIGRLDAVSWLRWNQNLQLIAANPVNTVAANNRYDKEYMQYFTGIDNVLLLPNFCNYVGDVRYSPTRPEILLAPARGINPVVQQLMYSALQSHNSEKYANNHSNGSSRISSIKQQLTISPIRELYRHFQYSDLASHPAMVVLPYQVSFMSLFEFYRMQIPLFVPTPSLLTEWHMKYRILNERTWQSVMGNPQHSSTIQRHYHKTHYNSKIKNNNNISRNNNNDNNPLLLDPNDEFSADAVLQWITLSDFYQWPYIQTFSSWDELFMLLTDTTQLQNTSDKMGLFNKKEEVQIKLKWRDILHKIRRRKNQLSSTKSSNNYIVDHNLQKRYNQLPFDINDSLESLYGYRLSNTDCKAQIFSEKIKSRSKLRGANNIY